MPRERALGAALARVDDAHDEAVGVEVMHEAVLVTARRLADDVEAGH